MPMDAYRGPKCARSTAQALQALRVHFKQAQAKQVEGHKLKVRAGGMQIGFGFYAAAMLCSLWQAPAPVST